MAKKKQLDYENIIHRRENTKFNEQHLNNNRYHFTGQALVVLGFLQKGHYISSEIARDRYYISDLQRRIGDLGEYGEIDIDRDYKLRPDGKMSRFLVYFLPKHRKQLMKRKIIANRPRWWYSELYTPTAIINEVLKNKK